MLFADNTALASKAPTQGLTGNLAPNPTHGPTTLVVAPTRAVSQLSVTVRDILGQVEYKSTSPLSRMHWADARTARVQACQRATYSDRASGFPLPPIP